jgi:3-oxoacyl-[acyl-carrier protein] reductase
MIALDYSRLGPPPGATVLICGGLGGIGRAVVEGCLATGLRTLVLDLPGAGAVPGAIPAAIPTGARFVGCDATDETSVRTAIAEISAATPALAAVINLIGGGDGMTPTTDMDLDRFERVMNRNLRTAFLISKHTMPLLKRSGAGSLIHTASGAAFRAISGTADYTAAKGGLVALTRLLAAENAPEVRVNVIAPGGVTNRVKISGDAASDPSGLNVTAIQKQIPLGRFADPSDLVGPILFLAGPASGYITGQTLHLNGGLWMA